MQRDRISALQVPPSPMQPLRRARATLCAVQAAAALRCTSVLVSMHTQWGSNHHSSATAPRRLNYDMTVCFTPNIYAIIYILFEDVIENEMWRAWCKKHDCLFP